VLSVLSIAVHPSWLPKTQDITKQWRIQVTSKVKRELVASRAPSLICIAVGPILLPKQIQEKDYKTATKPDTKPLPEPSKSV
jgi:hypothetical protein